MTLLGNVLSARNSIENPAVPLTDTSILEMLGADKSLSGKSVNEITALGLPAVWRAMQVTCNVPAALPLHAYRHNGSARVLFRLYDVPVSEPSRRRAARP